MGRQSERQRPVHIDIAQQESLAGAHRLAMMAREPLPSHLVALYIAHNAPDSNLVRKFSQPATQAGTYATISAEARALLEAEQNGASITHVGADTDKTQIYKDVQGKLPPPEHR